MKVFVILLIAGLAGAAGFLFGTDTGRSRRDDLVARVRRTTGSAADSIDDAVDKATDVVTGTADDAVDQISA